LTLRQFEKKVSAVLAGYRRYNILSHKTWKEDSQLFLSVKLGPEMLRKEPWGVYAVFDKDGKLIKSSCGSLRDAVFTRILMKRIEAACSKNGK
jgi:hypothetical protein